MSEIDWDAHRTRFFARKMAGDPITIKAYADENGLSPNTARKYLNSKIPDDSKEAKPVVKRKKKRSDPVNDPQNDPEKPTKKHAKLTKTDKINNVIPIKKPSFARHGKPGKIPIKTKKNNNLNEVIQSGESQEASSDPLGETPEIKITRLLSEDENEMIRIKGLEVIQSLRPEAVKNFIGKSNEEHMSNVIQMAQRSLMEFQAIANDEMRRVRSEVAALQEGETPPGGHPNARLVSLSEKVAYVSNDFLTRLTAVYQREKRIKQLDEKNKLADRQLAFKEYDARQSRLANDKNYELREKESVARLHELDIRLQIASRSRRVIADAIRLREQSKIDDIGVAEYIERQGVSTPPVLLLLAKKAIDSIVPTSTDIDIDAEKLDEEAKKYAEYKRSYPDWLAARRVEVEAAVDKLGLGDVDNQGFRRSGESDPDDDIDIDYGATADLYDEPDNSDYDEEIDIDNPYPER